MLEARQKGVREARGRGGLDLQPLCDSLCRRPPSCPGTAQEAEATAKTGSPTLHDGRGCHGLDVRPPGSHVRPCKTVPRVR